MQINKDGIQLIERWEGFYEHSYDDGEGVWTIGFGTTRWDLKTPVKRGETITREEADAQLRKELQRVQDAIDTSIYIPLTSNEYSALCSVFYNIGTGWCTGQGHAQATFVKNLNSGRKDLVPAGILQFVHGANTGKAYTGLMNRRRDEVKLWLTPDEPSTEQVSMPQAVAPVPAMSTAQAIKSSPTIGAATVGAGTAIASAVANGIKEAGDNIAVTKDAISPFSDLLGALHINVSTVSVAVILGCLAFVVIRHIRQKKEGLTQ